MNKRLKKILGIGILVPILFLVIGLNIKPKCLIIDAGDLVTIANSDNKIFYSAHVVTPGTGNPSSTFLLNVEWLTPDNDFRKFRLDYDYQSQSLNLTNENGTTIGWYNNDTLDNLVFIFSLCNVGQNLVIVDFFLYKNIGSSFSLISSTNSFEYGYSRLYAGNVMLYEINTINLTSFNDSEMGINNFRRNPLEYLGYYYFNIDNLVNQSYTKGFNNGRNEGYNQGLEDAGAFSENLWFFTPIITGISSLLSIQIYPNVSIGTFLLIPLALGIIGLILVFWRKD